MPAEENVTPILRVKDAAVAAAWYARLGFVKTNEHRFTPKLPAFVTVERGPVRLFLSEHEGDARPDTLVYLTLGGLDAIAKELGAKIEKEPWGRELETRDPDGNRLRIGELIPRAGREIVSTRLLKAPVDRVFTAWTDPAILASWFGPKGFTCTFSEFEPRPGGWWRFVMHGPDGTDHRNESLFLEVVPNERIAFDHVSGPKFRATVTLTPAPQGTQILWSMLFATAKEHDAVKGFAIEGNQQNLDKLESVLARERAR